MDFLFQIMYQILGVTPLLQTSISLMASHPALLSPHSNKKNEELSEFG